MDKLLSEKSCAQFGRLLAGSDPVPGGGGAGALIAMLSAALCSMAGTISLGKGENPALEEIVISARSLAEEFTGDIDRDARAFEPLSKAFRLPKDDRNRAAEIARCSYEAAMVPFNMLKNCARLTELLENSLEHCKPMLISDIGCAAAACQGAMNCCAMNVFVNTGAIGPEGQELNAQVKALLAEYLPRCQSLIDLVRERLEG